MLTLDALIRSEADPELYYSDASNRERGDEPPPEWLLDGLLPHGATAIISDPGLGKSMVLQQVIHHLCYGRPLGSWPAPAPGTYRAWVLDLEGDASLNRERSYAITPYGQLLQDGRKNRDDHWVTYTHTVIPRSLRTRYKETYSDIATRHLAYLDHMLTDQAEAGQPVHLVVIDTLAKFLGGRPRDANAYDWEARVVGELNRLGTKHRAAIALIHHTNKAGQISGSQGIAGSCTVACKLELTDERLSDERLAVLRSLKVRNGAPFNYPMRQDPDDGTWVFLDTLTAAQAGNVGQKRQVLDELAKGPASVKELMTRIAIPHLKNILTRLARAREVRSRYGRWEIVPEHGAQVPGPAVPPAVVEQPELSSVDEQVTDSEEVNGFRLLQDSIAASRMKPVMRIRGEDRDQQPWSLITERMTGEHRWYPADRQVPDGHAIGVYDRRGSYPSAMSSVPVAANILTHTGRLDYRRRDQAGIFLVDEFDWTEDMPHPLGRVMTAPGPHWISTPHMDLLEKLSGAKRIRMPRILDSWTGRGTAGLFTAFSKAVKQARAAATTEEELIQVKRTTSIAIRCLWPKGARSPFWRPDWSVSVRAEAAVRLWVRADQVLANGYQLAGLGGVDELSAVVPVDQAQDPDWAPAPLVAGEAFGQVHRKALMGWPEWLVHKRLGGAKDARR